MNFNRLVFLLYLPVVVLLYWILPHKVRWVFLLVASYFFYAYENFYLLSLILIITILSFTVALLMEKTEKKGMRKLYFILSLVIILGILFVFKYLNFTLESAIGLINLFSKDKLSFTPFALILPVGISFYTFQTLGYVIDVYKGKSKAEHHFGYYALFVSFFPQLVAGPIEKVDVLLPQLKENHKLCFDDFSEALPFLISGFVKKIVIADFLAIYVDAVYSNVLTATGFSLLLATILFAFQIYGDFSGYCDIAMGCARLLGIKLTQNFERPYLSHSVREFFRRWHVTLNNWFTEYIYIPLGGSRHGKARQILNVLIVFLLSGLWHGASFHYVIWGLLNGIYICIEILTASALKRFVDKTPLRKKIYDVLSIGFTFVFILSTWVFFRSKNVMEAFHVYQRIFTSFLSGSPSGLLSPEFVLRIALSFLLLLLIPYLFSHKLILNRDGLSMESFAVLSFYAVIILAIGFAWTYQLQTSGESGFIYFQF